MYRMRNNQIAQPDQAGRVLAVRFNDEESRYLEILAAHDDLKLSSYIKKILRQAARNAELLPKMEVTIKQ
jgi:hypothetical protein